MMADLENNSAETLAFSEALVKSTTQGFGESIQVNAFYPAMPYFHAADLGIYSDALTPDAAVEFIRTRAPIGYSRFKDFVAGEYKFQKAYIDFVFKPLDGSDTQISLTEARVFADVPDKAETNSGTITNAAAGLTVNFTVGFAVAPRVTVTPISSTTPVVAVLTATPTITGFTVKLFDLSGNAVTGSFMWTALGY